MSTRSAHLLVVGAFLCVALPALARGAADPRDADLDVARSAVHEGLVLFAVPVLERLTLDRGFPARDEATLLLARCRFALRRYDEAARLLDGYEQAFPEGGRFFLVAIHDLARVDLERARASTTMPADRAVILERARLGFLRVLEESTDRGLLASGRFLFGVTLYEEGQYAAALEAFARSRSLGIPPADAESLALHTGSCHLQLRSFTKALDAFQVFVDNFPASKLAARGYYGLGEARYYLEDWQRAADAYEKSSAAALAESDADMLAQARYARGWALAKLGEKRQHANDAKGASDAWRDALSEFESLATMQLGMHQESAAFEAGELLHKLGRYAEAAERLMTLTDPNRHPTHAAAALYRLGDCRYELGQMREAADSYSDALEKAAATGELERRARFGLAAALVELEQPARAREVLAPLTASSQITSVRAKALFEMGAVTRRAAEVALRSGRTGEAAELFAEAYAFLEQLGADQAAMAEFAPERVAYWRGRSADDRARLAAGSGAENPWFDRALEGYRLARGNAGWSSWAVRALTDEARLQTFRANHDGAVAAYHELLSHDRVAQEVQREARLLLARAELERGRPQAAREALAPIVAAGRETPERAEALYNTAVSHQREGAAPAEAERVFVQLLEEYPQCAWVPDAIAQLGDVLSRQGRHAEAVEEYERLLAGHSSYPNADAVRLAAGHAAQAAGDLNRAVGQYRALFEKGTTPHLRARARLEEGRIAQIGGRVRDALRCAAEALATTGSGAVAHEAHELRGIVLMSLEQYRDAAAAFHEAMAAEDASVRERSRAEHAGALAALGRSGTLERPGETLRLAARAYAEAAQRAPDKAVREHAIFAGAEVLVELASVEEADGRLEDAAHELDEARSLLGLAEGQARARLRIREIELRRKALGQAVDRAIR